MCRQEPASLWDCALPILRVLRDLLPIDPFPFPSFDFFFFFELILLTEVSIAMAMDLADHFPILSWPGV